MDLKIIQRKYWIFLHSFYQYLRGFKSRKTSSDRPIVQLKKGRPVTFPIVHHVIHSFDIPFLTRTALYLQH